MDQLDVAPGSGTEQHREAERQARSHKRSSDGTAAVERWLVTRPTAPPPVGVVNAPEHDPAWLFAQCDQADKSVMLASSSRGHCIPLFVHPGRISLALGERALGHVRVTRHVLTANLKGFSNGDFEGLFDALAAALPANGVVFVQGLVEDEALAAALASPACLRAFRVLPRGEPYTRRLIRLAGGYEAYLKTLSAASRQNLRRARRKFEEAHAGRYRHEVFATPSEVARLLDILEPVSARTYQAKLLGLGIQRSNYIGRQLLAAAQSGHARCHLLSVDAAPIAWGLGLCHGDTYFLYHIGYDPDWRKWEPGNLLHLASIEDLAQHQPHVATFDFLYGDSVFKERLSNQSRRERNCYLIPRSPRGLAVHAAVAGMDRVSQTIGAVLSRWGLKEKMRRWVRAG